MGYIFGWLITKSMLKDKIERKDNSKKFDSLKQELIDCKTENSELISQNNKILLENSEQKLKIHNLLKEIEELKIKILKKEEEHESEMIAFLKEREEIIKKCKPSKS
ncbi:hypothetical protein MNB_SV-14-151 [hydrothermal vent metagenome]|uniref:Uncharacterized protein n=1 Tax=hydrothermal vent metagenome TaxID=652676 RepID=A0A1W1CNZ9_9ZZZZ